ncbi:MAG: glutamate synthase subunit beta [Mycobacteriales bacterium]
MPDPRGFLRHPRQEPVKRPVPVRVRDWEEVYPPADLTVVVEQATRCMDCGIPFCHSPNVGCPLGNRIPDWNDLVRTGSWTRAIEELHATNNFPEFTGKLCPAPCESACVLGIADDPVTIKRIEDAIIERAFDDDLVAPLPASSSSGRSVAIVGSGPAGLGAAQQLARAGHRVVVYERDEAVGGLLRYGIPDFKLEKHRIDRRLAQLRAEGVEFVTECEIGVDLDAATLRAEHDAVLLACGALEDRDAEIPGRELTGMYLAMDYLVKANRSVATGAPSPIDVADAHVVIIGGGDTAADCLGVAHRQGAASVTQLDRYPEPPAVRGAGNDPWPTWPWLLRTYPAHEEGGARAFAVVASAFLGDDAGAVRGVRITQVRIGRSGAARVVDQLPGNEQDIAASVVLLAIGFAGTEDAPLLRQLRIARTPAGVVRPEASWETSAPAVFVAGDMRRGASLIVWAIAEGRSAAAAIHAYLGGSPALPSPVAPDETLLRA